MHNPAVADFLDLLKCPISNNPLTVMDDGNLCSAADVSYIC